MQVVKESMQAATKGSEDWFTGEVQIQSLTNPDEPARASVARVSFKAGARTAWHTHPLGQTLVVTSGIGLVQAEGGPVQIIQAGDAVWTPPGTKHWHGAMKGSSMTHIAITEKLNGKPVDWLEHVTDQHYHAACAECET